MVMKYIMSAGPSSFSLTGGNSIGKRTRSPTHHYLEAGGKCGMWLEDDNRTYTEWWDEVTSETPWDQGKTPWDTKNDRDTAWDEVGTGVFEKTYWYDFEAIGEFLLEGENAGRGYTLHAVTGEFNVVGDDTQDGVITRRFRTGSFVLKGIRALMKVYLGLKIKAEKGEFELTGSPSTGVYKPRGIIDHTLDALPRSFILIGNESKGIFKKKDLKAGTGEFLVTELGQANFHVSRRSKYGDFRVTVYDLIGGTATNLTANSGTFILDGQSASLTNNISYRITADSGIFTLTGNNASAYVGGYADAGEFTVAGQDISSNRDRLLKAQPRAFKLTGMPSESTLQKIFYVGSTSYTLTGMDVKAKVKGGSKTGEFTLTGQESLREDHRGLSANAGSFILEGVSSGVHRFFDVYGTSYTLIGKDTNQHRNHINAAGIFKVEGEEAYRDRHSTLKVTEEGRFTVTGSNLAVTHGRSTLEGGSFVVDGQDISTAKDVIRSHEPTHYVLEGYSIDYSYEEREKAGKGTFSFYGNEANLKHVQHYSANFSGAAVFALNGKPTEQDRNQTLFAETGRFVVKYDCESKTLRAKAGEFELSGIRAVFNSKHYSFHAGPETHFRIELQTVGRYSNHGYGKTLEYKLTGSDVFFKCSDVDYTRWDSLRTNWDVFKTLWDRKYGADKPCPIRPATVKPATFVLTGKDVNGYTNNSSYPDAIEFNAGELLVNGAGSNQNWVAETGNFRVELTRVGYTTTLVRFTTEFTVTGNESRGLWYSDGDVSNIEEIPTENRIAAEMGEFHVNGQDSEGGYFKKPANVILLANHMAEYKVSGCDDQYETFWDIRFRNGWLSKRHGTAIWDSETAELAIKWNEYESYRTLWDKDKSRWDKKRCTQLNLDYRLVANCK